MSWCSAYKWRHLFYRSLAFTLQMFIWQESQCSQWLCIQRYHLKSIKSPVVLANRLLQNTVWVALQRKVLFSRDGLTPISLVSGKVGGLQVSIYTILVAKEKCIFVQGGCATQKSSWGQFHSLAGKSSCSTALFPFDEIMRNSMFIYTQS